MSNEINKRGNTVIRESLPNMRIFFLEMSGKDAEKIYGDEYTQCYIVRSEMKVYTYCEGDFITTECETLEKFGLEVKASRDFYLNNM